MYSFLILSIPVCIAFYCIIQKDYGITSFISPIIAGAFIGIVVSFIKEFFILSDYDVPANFFLYAIHLSWETILPIVTLTLFWFLISKDEEPYKHSALFPLIASFYAVFLPYETISSEEAPSSFFLFIKPPLLTGLIIISCGLILLSKKNYHSKKYRKSALFLALFVVSLFTEPVIQSLWYFKIASVLYLILFFIVILLTFTIYKIAFTQKTLDKPD